MKQIIYPIMVLCCILFIGAHVINNMKGIGIKKAMIFSHHNQTKINRVRYEKQKTNYIQKYTPQKTTNTILPCPICGADGYLHEAINAKSFWTVDCTVYDKDGHRHERVGKKWQQSKDMAIYVWNKNR